MILLRDFHLSRHAAIPIRAPPFCTIIYTQARGWRFIEGLRTKEVVLGRIVSVNRDGNDPMFN